MLFNSCVRRDNQEWFHHLYAPPLPQWPLLPSPTQAVPLCLAGSALACLSNAPFCSPMLIFRCEDRSHPHTQRWAHSAILMGAQQLALFSVLHTLCFEPCRALHLRFPQSSYRCQDLYQDLQFVQSCDTQVRTALSPCDSALIHIKHNLPVCQLLTITRFFCNSAQPAPIFF